MILVTGAGGKTGQAIMRALAVRGEAVRAFTSRTQKARLLPLAKEFYFGDLRDEAAVREAAKGAQALYHICPNMHPEELTIGRNAIAAAKAAGIAHFVYHSVLHPQTEKMPHHWNKLRVEEMLFESGLPFTVLQPAAYMQNILSAWKVIVEKGAYPVPYPVEMRLSLVDLEDVAEAAAVVLTEPGHAGATYELVGTPAMTQVEVAEVLSEKLKRPVWAEGQSVEAWGQRARANGLGDFQIETLIQMFHYYAQHGLVGNPNVLGWLLRRPPTSFAAFVERTILERLPPLPGGEPASG